MYAGDMIRVIWPYFKLQVVTCSENSKLLKNKSVIKTLIIEYYPCTGTIATNIVEQDNEITNPWIVGESEHYCLFLYLSNVNFQSRTHHADTVLIIQYITISS